MPDLILELSSSGYKWGDAHTKPKECVLSVFLQGIYDSPGDCSGFLFWEGNWGSDWINMYIHKFTYITYVRLKTVLYILCNMPKSRNLMTFIHCCVKLANANKIIHSICIKFLTQHMDTDLGSLPPWRRSRVQRRAWRDYRVIYIWYMIYSIFYILYYISCIIFYIRIFDIWYMIKYI